ncbi:MAG: hypothetical protein QOG21_7 [Actinomycetota bacterium]|nr:hypothetical protein [Actinomycetota bacterium]
MNQPRPQVERGCELGKQRGGMRLVRVHGSGYLLPQAAELIELSLGQGPLCGPISDMAQESREPFDAPQEVGGVLQHVDGVGELQRQRDPRERGRPSVHPMILLASVAKSHYAPDVPYQEVLSVLKRLAASVLAGTAVLALTAPALAAGPTRVHLDSTRVIAASPQTCPFDITSHFSGTFMFFNYPDGRSKVTVADVFVTYTNPVSGKSLTTPLAGPVKVSAPHPDGTVTVTINGNDGAFHVPGQGVIFADVGHFVFLADANDPSQTPLVVLQSSGIQDPSPFPGICSALA